jgi:L-histidine Nalpha-methyltransferase
VSFRLTRMLTREQLAEQLRREARAGLTASPKRMRSRWVWDSRGSELYGRIMELPQYYLPPAEREILAARGPEIDRLVHPWTVVELGPGSSVKTPLLLDALSGLERYVAIDVSGDALEAAGGHLAARYPELEIIGVVDDFETGLPEPAEHTLVVSLGSTIGGLDPEDRAALFTRVAEVLGDDGALLLGLDLLKPVERIVAAYTDEEGLSEGLISNLLPVLNQKLGADFEPQRFRGEAVWSEERGRMEMFVRSLEAQTVTLRDLGLTVEFDEGEMLRTEISTKFTRQGVEAELTAARLRLEAWWTDEAGDFALCLAKLAQGT